jgi:hypothetical protein
MATEGEFLKNPVRFLLHVPVPWVFVLTYLVGNAVERSHPLALSPEIARVDLGGNCVVRCRPGDRRVGRGKYRRSW